MTGADGNILHLCQIPTRFQVDAIGAAQGHLRDLKSDRRGAIVVQRQINSLIRLVVHTRAPYREVGTRWLVVEVELDEGVCVRRAPLGRGCGEIRGVARGITEPHPVDEAVSG